MDTSGRSLQSVERTCRILEILRREGEATLSEVGEEVDVSLGALHAYLNTLAAGDLVEREDKRYALGPKLLTLGESYRNNSLLYRAGRSEVRQLARETGESVHLIIEKDGRAMTLYEELGSRAVGTKYHQKWREQAHAYLHCTGAGKAILAHLPDERIEEIVDQGLVELTPNTITDPAELRADLEAVRERGFSLTDGEEVSGLRAVGVPIQPEGEGVLGAISLTAAANRLEGERFHERIPSRLQRSANVVEVNVETGDLAY